MSTWPARTRLARDQRRPDGFIKPCLLTIADRIPNGPEWQFEVKHDGYRMLARVDAGRPRIWSRHGLAWTKAFPSNAETLRAFGRDLVVDGQAVCQLEDGSSDFHRSRARKVVPGPSFGRLTSSCLTERTCGFCRLRSAETAWSASYEMRP